MTSLWKKLQQSLGLDDTLVGEPDEARALQYAAAALLLEMCDSDLERDPQELESVRHALRIAYALTAPQIDTLIERATREDEQQVSFYPHVAVVNEVCSPAQKATIVEQLWRVAFADGRLDKYEENYLRKLCDLIHVPHRVFLQTRHRVEAQST